MSIVFLICGGNTAFADSELRVTIKDGVYDHNGNHVELGVEYYLEPVDNSNTGIIAVDWSGGKWAALGPKSSSITVKFEERNVKYHERFGVPNERYFELPREFALRTNVLKTITVEDGYADLYGTSYTYDVGVETFLTARSNNHVEFVEASEELGPNAHKDATWHLYDKTQGDKHFMAFKDVATGKFLSHNTLGRLLYANKDSVDTNTLWKLIEK
ncbi:hypothetical protein FOA24_25870 [Bacillus thuringiensis]|uniref:hypothetical protein n=1 Tax=Bacillus thuringiensis TaxID=1428 RepID=UPI00333E1807